MRLRRHLNLIFDILASREEIVVERLVVDETIPNVQGIVEGRIRFWDSSLLEFVEVLEVKGFVLGKAEYAYHYQDRDNQLIFRYDNAPHHPNVPNFPHHKHVNNGIESATPPHLGDVLREIDTYLYAG